MAEALPFTARESSILPFASAVATPPPPLLLVQRAAWLRYTVAWVLVGVVFFGVKTFLPTIALKAPLAPLLAIILALAYYLGGGPSFLATVVGALLMQLFLLTPRAQAGEYGSVNQLRLIFFLLLGGLTSWLGGRWHRSSATLRDREQKLRILLDKMPVVLWSTDADLRLTSSSAAMSYLFPTGVTAGESSCEIDPDLFRDIPADSSVGAAQRRAVSGQSVSYHLERGERYFQVQVEPLMGASGTFTGSFGMAWDITAQHRAEMLLRRSNLELEARVAGRTEELANANLVLTRQITARKMAEIQRDTERELVVAEHSARTEAEALNRAKDHFLATLSHELRTPMTPVLLTVSSMEKDASLSEDARTSLRMIRRNVELEARLIDDLLDLTRISRGKLQMRNVATDVNSLLCHARDVCVADAAANRQTIDLRVDAGRCFVRGDATRLQQVFWNLLRNAIKFTPEGGTIRLVSANDASGKLLVQVIDTGIGIDPRLLPRIFDAFEQGGSEVTRRFGGLGLGLAISKAVIDLHGGVLSAQSEGPGKGSTFTVMLQTIDAPAPVIQSDILPTVEIKPLRILLVEDHPDTRKATARLLRMLGHDVATADGVAAGLEAAQSRPFDLIISDLGLPDGSGLDLMREIKQRYGLKGIALSGFGMDTDLHDSSEAGFDCHLVKPVPLEELEAAVRRVGGSEVEAAI